MSPTSEQTYHESSRFSIVAQSRGLAARSWVGSGHGIGGHDENEEGSGVSGELHFEVARWWDSTGFEVQRLCV